MWQVGVAASLLMRGVLGQITTTYVADLICTRDEVYSSLSREGREFCESVLEDSCETLSKPVEYSSLEDEQITSYCECILTANPESTQTGSANLTWTDFPFPSATASSPTFTASWSGNGTVSSTSSSSGSPVASASSGQTTETGASTDEGYNSTIGASLTLSPGSSSSSGEVLTGWNSTTTLDTSTTPVGAGSNSTISGSVLTSTPSGSAASSEVGTVATGAETTSTPSGLSVSETRFSNSTSFTHSTPASSTGTVGMTSSTTYLNQTIVTSSPTDTASGNVSAPVLTSSEIAPSSTSQAAAQSSGSSLLPSGSVSDSWNGTTSVGVTTRSGVSGTGSGVFSTGTGVSWSGQPTSGQSSSTLNETGGGFTVQPTSATNGNLSLSSTTFVLPHGSSGVFPSSSRGQVPWPANTTSIAQGSVSILPVPFPTGTGIPVPPFTGSDASFTRTIDTTSGTWNSTDGIGGGFTWPGETNSTTLKSSMGPSTTASGLPNLTTTDGGPWTGPWNSTMTSTAGPASQGSVVSSTDQSSRTATNATGAETGSTSLGTEVSFTLPTLITSATDLSTSASDGINSSFTGWNSSLSSPTVGGTSASDATPVTTGSTILTDGSLNNTTSPLSPTGTGEPWFTANRTITSGTYTSSPDGSISTPIGSEVPLTSISGTANQTAISGSPSSESSSNIFTRTDGSTSVPIGSGTPWTWSATGNETFTWGTYSSTPGTEIFTRTNTSGGIPTGTEGSWTRSTTATGNETSAWSTYRSGPTTDIFTRTDGSISTSTGMGDIWTSSRTDSTNDTFTRSTYSSTPGANLTSQIGVGTSSPIGSGSPWTLSGTGTTNKTSSFGTYSTTMSSTTSGAGSAQLTSPSPTLGPTQTTAMETSEVGTASETTETGPYSFGNSSIPTRSYISATVSWSSANMTTPTPVATPIPAENFTDVARAGALKQEYCYHLPRTQLDDYSPPGRRRALLRNSKLVEANVSVPVPYIESIDFEDDGVLPLFMTVRDDEDDIYYLDISNRSRLAIVDRVGNSMLLDDHGVYFATNSCRFDVNITIADLFSQVANLSEADCSFGNGERLPDGFIQKADDIQFDQTLYLRDQCGTPITGTIREYPELMVGDTRCKDVGVDEGSGRWDFDCTWPGILSGTLQCQKSVQDNVIDLLTRDPFGGACPDLPSMVAIFTNTSNDIISRESIRTELENHNGDEEDLFLVDSVVSQYERLWKSLQEFFVTNSTVANDTGVSPWEIYFAAYNTRRNLIHDICEELHVGEIPLSISLRAGVSFFPSIATLNWAPSPAREYNITVQDPTAVACCSDEGSVAETEEDEEGGNETCSYPPEAFIQDTSCICGRAVSGGGLAFEATECENFEGTCEADEDCSGEFVCLTGTCCGGGVCVDPYACSQNGTELVKYGDQPIRMGW